MFESCTSRQTCTRTEQVLRERLLSWSKFGLRSLTRRTQKRCIPTLSFCSCAKSKCPAAGLQKCEPIVSDGSLCERAPINGYTISITVPEAVLNLGHIRYRAKGASTVARVQKAKDILEHVIEQKDLEVQGETSTALALGVVPE